MIVNRFSTILICSPEYIQKDDDIECIVVSSCKHKLFPSVWIVCPTSCPVHAGCRSNRAISVMYLGSYYNKCVRIYVIWSISTMSIGTLEYRNGQVCPLDNPTIPCAVIKPITVYAIYAYPTR